MKSHQGVIFMKLLLLTDKQEMLKRNLPPLQMAHLGCHWRSVAHLNFIPNLFSEGYFLPAIYIAPQRFTIPEFDTTACSDNVQKQLTASRKISVNKEQSILIIHGVHISEFAYSLKFICNPQVTTHDAFMTICRRKRSKHIELLNTHMPSWSQTKAPCVFLF